MTGPPQETMSFDLPTPDGPITVKGRLLGFASSQRDQHSHDDEFVAKGGRCSACRWFEVRIIALTDDDDGWLVHTTGKTTLPDEREYCRAIFTESAFEVIEALTVRKTGTPSLPGPSARAVSQAAQHDEDIRDAYVNRAVA